MRYLFLLALTFFSVSLATPASAQLQGVGVVNIQKIMKDSKAAVSVRQQLQTKQKQFQSELDTKEKALQKEDQELAKQRANLSQEAFNQKVEVFRKKALTARQEIQNKRAQLDKGFSGALGQIQNNTVQVIAQVAKEKKLSLVISGSQVLYGETSLDITAEVLKRLDSKLPSVTVKF